MRGAYVNTVCEANSLLEAVNLICSELSENALELVGFDFIFDERYMDRALSDYETLLAERLHSYPVQFEDVHLFPADS